MNKVDIKQQIINDYNSMLIDKEKQRIESIYLGVVKDNCDTILFSILTHCIENIDIFNNNQRNNISNLINKLSYG